ncbi:pilus assembly protein PilP [Alkanindiges hydrocarboniclasticus]|jgi:type IV pilus assembly protein PilP|uniref:Pilus assembly protein PilP n=1 Tax=Alkanindiges hydrocarboniclasticus TaxID=1907941 RepID=A0A1S8CTE2_9GAMM|nr:pilus assembly protein PilP [Alkanindiges hydrocarboniclasticus]ONG38737.1 pilus assembly protein PilP [Alkanindiges hydrocarboniclasticus]
MKLKLLIITVSSTLLLTGCSSRLDVVNEQMQQIRSQPPQPVPPAPVFLPVPSFAYSAQQLRSPFMPPSLAMELSIAAGRQIMPDLSRPPQYLEQFPIESLIMKGTLRRSNGSLYGLIQAPEGGVVRVEKGNYLGKNYGRIVDISPSQISVVEIVPNGREGFVERPRNLVMIDVGA